MRIIITIAVLLAIVGCTGKTAEETAAIAQALRDGARAYLDSEAGEEWGEDYCRDQVDRQVAVWAERDVEYDAEEGFRTCEQGRKGHLCVNEQLERLALAPTSTELTIRKYPSVWWIGMGSTGGHCRAMMLEEHWPPEVFRWAESAFRRQYTEDTVPMVASVTSLLTD